MIDGTPEETQQDVPAMESPFITRRRLLGTALGGALLLGGSTSLVAAARNDGKGDDDDHDGDDHHDEDDHDDDDKDHDDDDDHGRQATQLADGSWQVRITDDDADAFVPGTIAIQPGESVTWVNEDDKPHTATGAGWDTGTIDPGASATVLFEKAGSFAYACTFHPKMTGTVNVGEQQGTPVATPATGGDAVQIINLAYEPATLTVAAGTTVTWTNDDSMAHTATSSDGTFDTTTIAAGATAKVTFDTPGTFEYVCAFHPGMRGTIVVT